MENWGLSEKVFLPNGWNENGIPIGQSSPRLIWLIANGELENAVCLDYKLVRNESGNDGPKSENVTGPPYKKWL